MSVDRCQQSKMWLPVLRVEFRDGECAAALGSLVASALRGVPLLGRVQPVDGCPLLLQAWDSPTPPDLEEGHSSWPLFVEDATPTTVDRHDVPAYSKKFDLLDNNTTTKTEEKPPVPGTHKCFNCDDFHTLRDCPHPKNFNKINQSKKEMRFKFLRYHADEQAQLESKVPGKISKNLRRALGLNRFQLPLHIYKMRIHGYPPGWLLHARVSHSGLSLFDSHGKEVKDPEYEEGEHSESKDKYDIKKIQSFPGFNTVPSSKYIDESEGLGYPPFSKEHSKMAMIEQLAPIAAKAYRRRKMSEIKTKKNPSEETTQEDMDIDDESDEFCDYDSSKPFIPPLPPPIIVPPPPPTEVPPEPLPPGVLPDQSEVNDNNFNHAPNISNIDKSPDSPTLNDLEMQHNILKAALEEKDPLDDDKTELEIVDSNSANDSILSLDLNKSINSNKSGTVRESDLGTPIFNFSPFSQLPGSDSFSKDITSVMNFENLPNSIGKYGQMSGLIKKVREAVTRIQESDL